MQIRPRRLVPKAGITLHRAVEFRRQAAEQRQPENSRSFLRAVLLVYLCFQTDKRRNHRLPYRFRHLRRQACFCRLRPARFDDLGDAVRCGDCGGIVLGLQLPRAFDPLLPLRQQADELFVQSVDGLADFLQGFHVLSFCFQRLG